MLGWKNSLVLAITGLAACTTEVCAFEFGSAGYQQKPGLVVGNAAPAPPPGLYGFDQLFTYQAKLVGPGAPNVGGRSTDVGVWTGAAGLLWVPGWNILGASYDAVAVLPYVKADVGSPLNLDLAGIHNPFIAPIELSWRLGDSGFFVKAGLGIYVPVGTTSGPNGLGSVGTPWWTFQPNLVVSYFKDGWNLTANVFQEINTKSTVTDYRSGDILHLELTATKRFGSWTAGPVAYYVGQVTDDRSSAFYGGAINVNRYNVWAVGGLVSYDFGPVALNVWALNEVSANASGGTAGPPGLDTASTTKGYSVFASISYRIWGPSEPQAPSNPRFHK